MLNNDIANKKKWGEEIKKNVMLYPNEHVVRFMANNYKDIHNNSIKMALDIGFGSGRHLKLLLDYGFQTYGIDYSEESLMAANEILGNNNMLKKLELGDFKELNYGEGYFDVVIMYGVAFLRCVDEIIVDLKFVNQLLKKDGKMIINFRTKEDHLFGNGEEIYENSFILDEKAKPYEGMLYTFLDNNEVVKLLNDTGFVVEKLEREDYWKNNLTEHHSWWIISVRKE